MRFFVSKNCSAALLLLLFFSTLMPTALTADSPSPDARASVDLSNLSVPEELGKVQERFMGNSQRLVVQIQDVHAHPVAQQNIAAILERLRTVFALDEVGLEGAWVSTSLSKSHALATSREKQLLASTLLDDDRISGPVYAAIMSPKPITLTGLEEENLYEKDRALFREHLTASQEIREKLLLYTDTLKEQQKASWVPELLSFGNAFANFRETSNLGEFFPLLCSVAATHQTATSDLPQILLMQDILALERSFEKSRLEKEVKALMREYKNTPWTVEELLRGGKIPTGKLGLYPELKKMTRLFQLRDQLVLRDLIVQIETLTRRVLEMLIRTPEENALWKKTERFYLAKRLLLFQATPSDLRAFEQEKSFLEAELEAAGLSKALSLSLEFYQVVKKRDELFFDKIMRHPSLAGNIAVVTGGFHTDGLSERLRAAGISYVTIAPDLGGASMNEKLYESRMTEGEGTMGKSQKPEAPSAARSSSHSTLSELRNALAWIDERFPPSYEVLLQTRDVRKAILFFLGGTVRGSTPDQVSRLFREGKVVKPPASGPAARTLALKLDEFMSEERSQQLQAVRDWLKQGQARQEKAMLVSSLGILSRVLAEKDADKLLKNALENGGMIALAQDLPITETPEILSSTRGIERFEAKNVATLIEKTPRFQRLAKKHPFAIMENGFPGGPYVVLPEKAVSLTLFGIITLNPSLYQAAKNPAFLTLLEDLVSEVLSQELPEKSA